VLKKISVITSSIILILSLFILNRVPTFNMAKEYEVYFTNYSSTHCQKTDKNNFKFILGVKGESCTLEVGEFCLEEFLSQMEVNVYFIENLENTVCYYGYSPKVKYLEMINGKIINVHIVISKNYVKIGFPIIYGSF